MKIRSVCEMGDDLAWLAGAVCGTSVGFFTTWWKCPACGATRPTPSDAVEAPSRRRRASRVDLSIPLASLVTLEAGSQGEARTRVVPWAMSDWPQLLRIPHLAAQCCAASVLERLRFSPVDGPGERELPLAFFPLVNVGEHNLIGWWWSDPRALGSGYLVLHHDDESRMGGHLGREGFRLCCRYWTSVEELDDEVAFVAGLVGASPAELRPVRRYQLGWPDATRDDAVAALRRLGCSDPAAELDDPRTVAPAAFEVAEDEGPIATRTSIEPEEVAGVDLPTLWRLLNGPGWSADSHALAVARLLGEVPHECRAVLEKRAPGGARMS